MGTVDLSTLDLEKKTAASSKGAPSDFAMAAGVKKMPSAIDCSVTKAIVPGKPMRLC